MVEMHRFDLAQLSATVIGLLPKLSEREKVISLGLYRLLAEGLPVSCQQLATALNLPLDVIKDTLAQWWGVYYDGDERITGYWGLAFPQMPHRFLFGGKTLYTCCVWDTLFILELLGQTVRVESNCPKTRRRIQLTVAPQGVSDLDPPGAVMSLLTP
jgi:alkylmercury lyase